MANKSSFFQKHPSTAMTSLGLTTTLGAGCLTASITAGCLSSLKDVELVAGLSRSGLIDITIGLGVLCIVSSIVACFLYKKAQVYASSLTAPLERKSAQDKAEMNLGVGIVSGICLGFGIYALTDQPELAFPAVIGAAILIGLVIRNYCSGCVSIDDSYDPTAAIPGDRAIIS